MAARPLEPTGTAVGQETADATIARCVERAAGRAARQIPHLDPDCLAAMLRAHVETRLDRFRGEAPLEHWVNRVLKNKVADLVRFERCGGQEGTRALEPRDEELADPTRGPGRRVEQRELVQRIRGELGDTREGRILLMILSGEATTITQAAQLVQWNHPTALARLRRLPLVQELARDRQTA